MVQKRTLIGVASFFLVFTLLVGYYALAAEAGGRENPLVTVGYLETLDIDAKIAEAFDTYFSEQIAELDRKIADVYASIGDAGGESGVNLAEDEAFINAVAELVTAKAGTPSGAVGNFIYEKVTIPAGKTMSLTMGSSFLLRVGSAVCVATGSPGLIDYSSPGEVANGAAIEKNHMYLVTVEGGRGLKNNGSADVIVFVMGSYTIE